VAGTFAAAVGAREARSALPMTNREVVFVALLNHAQVKEEI